MTTTPAVWTHNGRPVDQPGWVASLRLRDLSTRLVVYRLPGDRFAPWIARWTTRYRGDVVEVWFDTHAAAMRRADLAARYGVWMTADRGHGSINGFGL